MKQLAVVLAAVLSLTLVAPALAQPFADVPTDHWAYDAIAELAAKGLIEGYPDGSFKGDRAMTRYEMAMVVARLLARIEAIKIPPLPGDLVRRADLDKATAAQAAAIKALDSRLTAKLATVQRLVAEFRAELAALGVRVTAVEEELAAIRARLDNTRVTGDARIRYNVFPVGTVSGGGTVRHPDIRLRTRLTFTGTVAPNVTAVIRLFAANNAQSTGTNYDFRFGNVYSFANVSYDLAYIDIRRAYTADLWRIGRQFYTLIGLGPFSTGLIYDPANSVAAGQVFSGTNISGLQALPLAMTTTGLSEGIRADWTLGPLSITGAIFRDNNVAVGGTPGVGAGLGAGPPGIDYRIVHASTRAFLPGWTLGGAWFQAWQHPNSSGVPAGGSAWQGYLSGTLIPGLTMYGEYASWTAIDGPPGTTPRPATKAWRVGGNANLAVLAGITTWSPTLDFQYHDYGPLEGTCIAFAPGAFPSCWPVYTYATTIVGQMYAFNMRGWLARLNLTFSPATSGWILYESGSNYWPVGGTYSEWWLRLAHRLAPSTTLTLNYYQGNGPFRDSALGDIQRESFRFYRAELLWSW
jgi:hypothetical protein